MLTLIHCQNFPQVVIVSFEIIPTGLWLAALQMTILLVKGFRCTLLMILKLIIYLLDSSVCIDMAYL